MKIGLDFGSGKDETAITMRIGDEFFTIPDPFASALAPLLSSQEEILALLKFALTKMEEDKKRLDIRVSDKIQIQMLHKWAENIIKKLEVIPCL